MKREEGFTLIEIIVVMAIIVILISLVVVSARSLLGKGYQRVTESRILQLEQFLDRYKSVTGEYPPDGFDSPQKNDQGSPIQGAACLHYFLTKPVQVKESVAGKITLREEPPITEFKEGELSPEDADYPGVREIVDGWETPLHYDNTEDGEFKPQTGDAHIPPADEETHPDDPRTGEFIVDGKSAVSEPGIQTRKGFDIWSHAGQSHESKPPKELPIATWNLKR